MLFDLIRCVSSLTAAILSPNVTQLLGGKKCVDKIMGFKRKNILGRSSPRSLLCTPAAKFVKLPAANYIV